MWVYKPFCCISVLLQVFVTKCHDSQSGCFKRKKHTCLERKTCRNYKSITSSCTLRYSIYLMAYTWRLGPKGVPFSGFRFVWKGGDFSIWSIWKSSEILWSVKWPTEGTKKDNFYGCEKVEKMSYFVIYSYIEQSGLYNLQQLKEMQSSKLSIIVKGIQFSNER